MDRNPGLKVRGILLYTAKPMKGLCHGQAYHHRQRADHAPQGRPKHLGVHPGEKLAVEKLPGGRIELKAERATGKISDVFNFLKRENGPSLSIEEINEAARRGWAGRRR